MRTHMHTHGIQRATFKSLFSSPTMWVLRMELRPSDLEASALSHWTIISAAPK